MNKPSEEQMITTIDNPFNPHTQWEEWYGYDVAQGYNTLSVLARMTYPVEGYDDGDLERAQAEMVRLDPLEKYLLVTRKNFDALITEALEKKNQS